MPHRRPILPRVLFLSAVAAVVLLAQLPWTGTARHAAAADATPSTAAPGLTLSFAADGPPADVREARLVALAVPPGGSPSPFLKPGAFTATWTGLIATPRKIKEEYRFTAEGTGQLRVTLNDQPVLDLTGDLSAHPSDLVTLHKARNRLTVTYRPPADGPASVRLLWARDDHPDAFDPVPPTVFTHDATDAAFVRHGRLRLGRDLLASMRCIACHQGVAGTVPELHQDAPNLTDVQRRLRPGYLARWIADPRAVRPTTDMPRVVRDAATAADVAAYLSADAPPEPPPPPADVDALAKGARLFTGLGCIACHVAPGTADADPSLNRVSLNDVKAKFRPDGLAEWLHAPEAHYAWVKMPNFHPSEAEVTALSGWLLSRCKDDPTPPPAGDAARGKAAFASAGCMNCHAARDDAAPVAAAAVDLSRADWSKGCAGADPAAIGRGVDYGFTPDQSAALRAFAATNWQPTLTEDPPADFAARQFVAVRCNACHHVDGRDSVWSNLDTEASALESDLPPRPPTEPEPQGDQSPPPLTWTGEKLHAGWAGSFIAGRVPYKPRAWIFARMPSFATRAAGLAAGLAQEHGMADDAPAAAPADASLADVGRTLTSQTSFGCVKCHAVGSQPAIAPFEAYAPNFAHVTDRLRHDYYRRWMRDPQTYLRGTKMPSFGNADGKTPYKDVLGGDAAAEYEAIWTYLLAGDRIVPAQ